jgi:hypothetical protein
MREEHPSYLRFVNMGETTLPEYWRDDARSRNHDMLGHIMEWFYSGMAGITSEENAFKKIKISPWLPRDMKELQCQYHSIRGIIAVDIRRLDTGLQIRLTVPEGCEASVDFKKMFTSYRIQDYTNEPVLQGGTYLLEVFEVIMAKT